MIVSMVSHVDLLMYLVAVKSIQRWIDTSQFIVVNDGTLTQKDRDLLDTHLSSPTILDINSIDTGVCPSGGCWERLLTIIDLSNDHYVIQVDSDLLAVSDIPEVRVAIRQNRSFVHPTLMGRNLIEFSKAAELVSNTASNHVQVVAEKHFPHLAYRGKRYVRGCAGFSGFARGSVSRDEIARFSSDLERVISEKWFEWGSEQVASNFLIANSPDPIVLPFPKYANFNPSLDHTQTHLFHFIGDFRYSRGRYIELSRQVIRDLD